MAGIGIPSLKQTQNYEVKSEIGNMNVFVYAATMMNYTLEVCQGR